jgi:hypothetical protein
MTTVYHVCGLTKMFRYLIQGYIKPPVRAWKTINEAERFSKQTGRQIILRLRFDNPKILEGHKGMAYFQDEPYNIREWLGFKLDKHKVVVC